MARHTRKNYKTKRGGFQTTTGKKLSKKSSKHTKKSSKYTSNKNSNINLYKDDKKEYWDEI
jgi:hypothetical protein